MIDTIIMNEKDYEKLIETIKNLKHYVKIY